MSKKADGGMTFILVLILIVGVLFLLNSFGKKECRSNKECNSESYCGSDFRCHEYPNIQKTVVQYNLLVPSLLIGIALVAAALIFKWNTLFPKHEKKVEEEQIKEEKVEEDYYKSSTNPRVP